MTMAPREAAYVVHHRTGAEVVPCTLHETSGDVARWHVALPRSLDPRICDDAELIAWAAELDALQDADRARDKDLSTRA